jgi:hypothetical protein
MIAHNSSKVLLTTSLQFTFSFSVRGFTVRIKQFIMTQLLYSLVAGASHALRPEERLT